MSFSDVVNKLDDTDFKSVFIDFFSEIESAKRDLREKEGQMHQAARYLESCENQLAHLAKIGVQRKVIEHENDVVIIRTVVENEILQSKITFYSGDASVETKILNLTEFKDEP